MVRVKDGYIEHPAGDISSSLSDMLVVDFTHHSEWYFRNLLAWRPRSARRPVPRSTNSISFEPSTDAMAAASPSVIQGIGDDAAVITSRAGQWTVLTTDLLTEGVHFDLRTATMADIGFRAAAANLSDIAAMGGTPQYLLVALAIPRTGTSRQVHQLYQGMMAACRPHQVRLIGGDTSASSGGWFLSVTLIGMVPPHKALFRSGARIGDFLYVTGTIGDALAGLRLLNEPPTRSKRHPRPQHSRSGTGNF